MGCGFLCGRYGVRISLRDLIAKLDSGFTNSRYRPTGLMFGRFRNFFPGALMIRTPVLSAESENIFIFLDGFACESMWVWTDPIGIVCLAFDWHAGSEIFWACPSVPSIIVHPHDFTPFDKPFVSDVNQACANHGDRTPIIGL